MGSLKPIPISLAVFWIHCPISFLFDKGSGISRLVVETGSQAGRKRTGLRAHRGKAEPCCESPCSATGRQPFKHHRHKPRLVTACLAVAGWTIAGDKWWVTVAGICTCGRGRKERYKAEMERKRVKKQLRRGLGDKLLDDRLQVVCSYITCFDLEALPYVVLN